MFDMTKKDNLHFWKRQYNVFNTGSSKCKAMNKIDITFKASLKYSVHLVSINY